MKWSCQYCKKPSTIIKNPKNIMIGCPHIAMYEEKDGVYLLVELFNNTLIILASEGKNEISVLPESL